MSHFNVADPSTNVAQPKTNIHNKRRFCAKEIFTPWCRTTAFPLLDWSNLAKSLWSKISVFFPSITVSCTVYLGPFWSEPITKRVVPPIWLFPTWTCRTWTWKSFIIETEILSGFGSPGKGIWILSSAEFRDLCEYVENTCTHRLLIYNILTRLWNLLNLLILNRNTYGIRRVYLKIFRISPISRILDHTCCCVTCTIRWPDVFCCWNV